MFLKQILSCYAALIDMMLIQIYVFFTYYMHFITLNEIVLHISTHLGVKKAR